MVSAPLTPKVTKDKNKELMPPPPPSTSKSPAVSKSAAAPSGNQTDKV